jgi:DNA polymerase I-like protein with 3'-5' exonuclease and polymerase domains
MLIALDTETTGVDMFHGATPFAVSTCDKKGRTRFWEWPVDPHTRQVMASEEEVHELVDYIYGSTLVFHNVKFDVKALRSLGIRLVFKDSGWASASYVDHKFEAVVEGFEDTLLASHVCNSAEPHGLKYLADKYVGIVDDDEEELLEAVRSARRAAKSKGWTLGEALSNVSSVNCDYWLPKAVDPSSEVLETYAVQDVVRTMLLWIMYREVMKDEKLRDHYETRKKLVPVTYRMEQEGITVKPRLLTREIKRYEEAAEECEDACIEMVASKDLLDDIFNIRSSIQISKVLYGDPEGDTSARQRGLNCPVIETTKTGASTSASTLLELYRGHVGKRSHARPFIANILTHRKNQTCAQYLSSYKALAIKEGKKPNGSIWFSADYSQLELRILAVLAKEEKLLRAFEEGQDIHSLTADSCSISRKAAKGVNYGLIYGAGKAKLEAMTGVKNFDKVFKEAFPGIGNFMDETIKEVRRKGYVRTISGYRLEVPQDRSYIGTNYKIQGSAGDILNQAMIDANKWLSPDDDFPKNNVGKLIMCIHDELVFDFKKGKADGAAEKIKGIMETAGDLFGVVTPVDVDRIDNRWSDKKGLDV